MPNTKTLSPLQQALKDARYEVKRLQGQIFRERLALKEAKATAKADRAAAAELKRTNAIAKAQARLQKLLDKQNPVGAKALKAARKPGAVTITKG